MTFYYNNKYWSPPEKPEEPEEFLESYEFLDEMKFDDNTSDFPLSYIPEGTTHLRRYQKRMGQGEYVYWDDYIWFIRKFPIKNEKYLDEIDNYNWYDLPEYEQKLDAYNKALEEYSRAKAKEEENKENQSKERRRKQYEQLKQEFEGAE